MLIQNYGLFWRIDRVWWGHPNYTGHLRGYSVRSQKRIADFREQVGLYVLYDSSFKMIYLGQAGANDQHYLFSRLKEHKNDQLAERWSRFSWFGIRAVNKDCKLGKTPYARHPSLGDVLNHMEAVLLTAVEPPHNRQGGRFGNKVEQFLQWRDEEALGPDSDAILRDIHEAVARTTRHAHCSCRYLH